MKRLHVHVLKVFRIRRIHTVYLMSWCWLESPFYFFFYMYNVNWLFQSAVIRPSLTSTYTSDKAGGLRDGLSSLESDNFWNWVPDKEVIDPENNGWHWNTYHVHNHSDQSSVRKTFTISTIIARSGRNHIEEAVAFSETYPSP